MAKYDNMVAASKERSRKKVEIAKKTISEMMIKNEPIGVSELVRRTGCTRQFFYQNPEVRDYLRKCIEKQSGKVLPSPRHETIERAQNNIIVELKKQLAGSVPKEKYDLLQKQFQELQKMQYMADFDSL